MVGNVIAEDAWTYANADDIDRQDFLGRLIGKRPIDLKKLGTHPFFFSFHILLLVGC